MSKFNLFSKHLILLFIVHSLRLSAFETIYTLEAYPDLIEKVRKEEKLSPAEMLICLDLDKVSVKDGTTKPFQGETTTRVYRTLIDKGYPVIMLTARNNGVKADEETWNDLYDMTIKLHNSLNYDSNYFSKLIPSEKRIRRNKNDIQYGYFINNVFYAGKEKGSMLNALLPALEKSTKKPFKVLFMVDDQKGYLQTFEDSKGLVNHFKRKNIHLVHFPEVREEGCRPHNSRKRKFSACSMDDRNADRMN